MQEIIKRIEKQKHKKNQTNKKKQKKTIHATQS